MKNTPIHGWNLPGIPDGFSVDIKRDDMTGSTLSGNKVRKLEFLMAEAIEQDCKHVITCGLVQSNHCRSVTIASTQLGLKTHLVQTSANMCPAMTSSRGNAFLNRVCGANIYLVPIGLHSPSCLQPKMEAISSYILKSTGEKSYIIPAGGKGIVGIYGYFEAFKELMLQGVLVNYDDIVVTCASGGTAEGIAIANYLNGSKLRVHSFSVCCASEVFYKNINKTLQKLGLGEEVRSTDIIDIVDSYRGDSYPSSSAEEQEYMQQVAMATGIILDPFYTSKTVRGLVSELSTNPIRFQGRRILFINTGTYSNSNSLMDDHLKSNMISNTISTFDLWQTTNGTMKFSLPSERDDTKRPQRRKILTGAAQD